MPSLLKQLVALIGEPPGSLVYHLVVLFALQVAAAIALSEWRRDRTGPAARLAKDCIKKIEVLEYPELGMEAVWKIDVVDFPAFIVVDDKGNDFFKELNLE